MGPYKCGLEALGDKIRILPQLFKGFLKGDPYRDP